MAYEGRLGWWDIYMLPIPIRKWLGRRWNKYQKGKESGQGRTSTDSPMSPKERRHMIQQAQQASKQPGHTSNQQFFGQIRNK